MALVTELAGARHTPKQVEHAAWSVDGKGMVAVSAGRLHLVVDCEVTFSWDLPAEPVRAGATRAIGVC